MLGTEDLTVRGLAKGKRGEQRGSMCTTLAPGVAIFCQVYD